MSDLTDEDYARMWNDLPSNAKETLRCLCICGPTYDGCVPSKTGRDTLLDKKMAAKIVIKNNEQGYQAATYLGSRVFRYGYLEPRKDIVRKLVGDPSQVRDRY